MGTLRNVIGLLALTAIMSGCYGHNSKKVADTNTNWLDCETSADCDDGLMCVEGRCSEQQQPEVPPEVPPEEGSSGGPPVAEGSDEEELPPPARVGVAFEGDPLVLSEQVSGPPFVRFLEDRWAVAWHELEPELSPTGYASVLHVLEVEPTGALGSAYVAAVTEVKPFERYLSGISSRGEAVIWVDAHRSIVGDACALQLVRWETNTVKDVVVPCAGTAPYVVDYNESSDSWVVGATDGDDVLLGVYAFDEEWLEPLTAIGEHEGAYALALATNGDAASVLWGNGEVSRGVDIADMSEPAAGTPIAGLDGAVNSEGGYTLVQLDDRTIAVGLRGGEGVWSSVLREGTASSARLVAGARLDSDHLRMAANAQETLVAVCFGTVSADASTRAISLIVIDRDGRPVSDPIMLHEEPYSGLGCDLAWSGDTLLVAWNETVREEQRQESSTLRAQRFVVTH